MPIIVCRHTHTNQMSDDFWGEFIYYTEISDGGSHSTYTITHFIKSIKYM